MTSLLLIPIIALAAQASAVAITDKVCITADCVQTADKILSSMDTSVDPCDNFYNYACGNWIKEHPIPDHKEAIDAFDLLSEKSEQAQRSALEEPVSEYDFEATEKAKVFYKSCMEAEDITDARKNWLREMIDDLGGWPVLGHEGNISLEHALARMQVFTNVPDIAIPLLLYYKPSGLLPVGLTEDDELRKKFIYIGSPSVSVWSKFYFDENKRKALHTYMTRVATLLGGDPEKAGKDLYEVLQFENRLVKRIKKFDQELKGVQNKLTLEELQEKVPHLNWTLYLQELFQTKDELKQDNIIKVSAWTIVEIGDLLENTDRRLLHNYIVWNAIKAMELYMTGDFKKARDTYRNAVEEKLPTGAVRWRNCVLYSQILFQKPLDYLYITRVPFDKEEDIAEMFGGIKAAFNESLTEKTWMDEKSRIATREKTMAIPAYTGYSKEFYNISEINGEFQGAMMSPHNFMENVKILHALGFQNDWQSLEQPLRELKWDMIAVIVNAFYAQGSNKVLIPAGIIRAPFYSSSFPNSMNYGGLGFVLGHELTHSVDSNNRMYDKDGNVQWWDNATIETFESRAKCLIDQYSAFKAGDGNDTYVKGKNTLGENISDNGGIRFAFRAYRKWVEKHGEEPLLPGLDLSHDQLFFLNTAQTWCHSVRPEELRAQIEGNSHSPAIARAVITLRNSADFGTAFNCPLGSPMNPVDKCVVW